MASIASLVEAAREPVGIDANQMQALVRTNRACHRETCDEETEFQFFVRNIYHVAHSEGTCIRVRKPLAFRDSWLDALKALGFEAYVVEEKICIDWEEPQPNSEATEIEDETSPKKKRKKVSRK